MKNHILIIKFDGAVVEISRFSHVRCYSLKRFVRFFGNFKFNTWINNHYHETFLNGNLSSYTVFVYPQEHL